MINDNAVPNIQELARSSESVREFALGYFDYLTDVFRRVDPAAIARLADMLEDARRGGFTVFVAGNGGSATTATSMANDIGFDIVKKTGSDRPFRVLALTDNNAVLTAIANDVGYENIFLQQLAIHYRDGDSLVVISASGNSKNLIRAASWVTQRGGQVAGLLGFDGGKLRDACSFYVHVPTNAGEYGPVEDLHLVINHILAHWFQKALKG